MTQMAYLVPTSLMTVDEVLTHQELVGVHHRQQLPAAHNTGNLPLAVERPYFCWSRRWAPLGIGCDR
jgi:hypothetical protein